MINESRKIKNMKLLGHVEYNKIPKILRSHKIILMPYSKVVYGNHKSANLSNYMSPLKLFDYLAAGRIIIASKNNSYSHILKNNKNSIICNSTNVDEWVKAIKKVSSNKYNYKKLQDNSIKTSNFFSWHIRVNSIIRFINKNFI